MSSYLLITSRNAASLAFEDNCLCFDITMRWAYSFAILLNLVSVLVGDSPDDSFISPPTMGTNGIFVANLVWSLGATQKIQWTTTLDSYNISLWQQAIDQSAGTWLATLYSTSLMKDLIALFC